MLKKVLKRNYVRFALLMSLIVLGCLLGMLISGNYTSFEKGGVVDTIFVLSPLVVWFFGIRNYKKQLKNKMTFKQGFFEGMRIALVFAILSPFIFLAYYTLLNPYILAYVRDAYRMTTTNSSAVIAVDMVVQFFGTLVLGAINSSIVSFILYTRK